MYTKETQEIIESLGSFAPELVLTFGLLIVIVADLILPKARRFGFFVSYVTIGVAWFLTFNGFYEENNFLFFNMLVHDPLTQFLSLIVLGSSLLITWVASYSVHKRSGEFLALLLLATIGMQIMVQSMHLIVFVIALEILSIASYVLAGFHKYNRNSSEASLKYVVYGSVASSLMIYGISFMFGLTGSFNLVQIAEKLSQAPVYELTLYFAFILILAGIAFKIALAPFHFWCPDVYEGAPTIATAFYSVGPKAAAFCFLMRWVFHAMDFDLPRLNLRLILEVMAILSMTIGNLSAIRQSNIKRMLAYSSIAHAGYMLMGLSVLNPESVQAVLIYFVIYLLMNLGAFFVVDVIEQKTGGVDIHFYKGLVYRNPFLSILLAVFLISLAGLPPMAGFIGKFYLFFAVLKAKAYYLALIGGINSVIALYYYINVARMMILEKAEEHSPVAVESSRSFLILGLAIPTIILGIFFQPLFDIAHQLMLNFLSTF